jgi:hypothetical protein
VNEILEAVTLCLYDHGSLTLNEIALITCIPLPSLRDHLHINRGERYSARMTVEDGVPMRRWSLIQEPCE